LTVNDIDVDIDSSLHFNKHIDYIVANTCWKLNCTFCIEGLTGKMSCVVVGMTGATQTETTPIHHRIAVIASLANVTYGTLTADVCQDYSHAAGSDSGPEMTSLMTANDVLQIVVVSL